MKKRGVIGAVGCLFTFMLCGFSIGAEPSAPMQDLQEVSIECWMKLMKIYSLDFPDVPRMLNDASPEQRADMMSNCRNSPPDEQIGAVAASRGKTLFKSMGCTSCHGSDARGGDRGPDLLRSQALARDKNGEAIGEVILKGRPGTSMPAFSLQDAEVVDLAAFLHDQRELLSSDKSKSSRSTFIGRRGAGRAFFDRQCARCHTAESAMSGIANRYSDGKELQNRWLIPQDASLSATITNSRGERVQGRVLKVDEFRVFVLLSDGTRRSFNRQDSTVDVKIIDPISAHRVLLGVYTDQDIRDVTAYLSTVRPVSPTRSEPNGAVVKVGSDELADQSPVNIRHELPPAAILNPRVGEWPTYSGDYSGRRYSRLSAINQSNVASLTLAWATRLTAGRRDAGSHPLIVAGEGPGARSDSAATQVRGGVLSVDGILYLSTPDNAWAVDASTGDTLWHFLWKTRGAPRSGNRGLGMWKRNLYLSTPDNFLVAIDAVTGHERWHVEIADIKQEYFSSSSAPIVVGNHVLVGSANTQNSTGFLKSFDADTGKLQWVHYSVPLNKGDPGAETWKDLEAARRGGGMVWIPGSFDPETNLYIYGTGNPTPSYFAKERGDRAALFTCAIIAVNVETGRMVWNYQVSPNDTHDWDAGLTPVLADIKIDDTLRKVALITARNGYFFVIDRVSGEHLLTSKFSRTANWAQSRLNRLGQPVRNPLKDIHLAGVLVSPANEGAANWMPGSYSPDYGLLYVPTAESYSMYYQIEPDRTGVNSESGKQEMLLDADSNLTAIDPITGRIAWQVQYPSRGSLAGGVLTTAGRLLFSGDTGGSFVARDPASGTPIWQTRLAAVVSNAPETYSIDQRQYILVAAADMLYAFTLPVPISH